MIANRRLVIALAALGLSGPAVGCRAMSTEPEAPALTTNTKAHDRRLHSGIWITYSPGGVASSTTPTADGKWVASVGGLRPPIFSVRLRSTAADGASKPTI